MVYKLISPDLVKFKIQKSFEKFLFTIIQIVIIEISVFLVQISIEFFINIYHKKCCKGMASTNDNVKK